MKKFRTIAIYSQCLHGVGHYVRACSIAAALCTHADIILINAGRAVTEPQPPKGARLLDLPGIFRNSDTGALHSELALNTLDATLGLRRRVLETQLSRQRVDLLLIEYFPFQRWEFASEIFFLIGLMKDANPDIRICCSVRDLPRPFETEQERRRIVDTLNDTFSHLFVHADPAVGTSVDAFSLLKDVVIPVTYTGYITASWRDRHESDLSGSDLERFRGSVIVSAGGGMDSYNMLATCIDTWEELQREGFDNRLMVLCLGAFLPQEQVDVLLTKVQRTPNIRAFRFPSTFRQLLSVADLSISCAGYNTCVDVMQARIRAIFIPSLSVSDQKRRAIRLQELGFGLAMSARTLQVADLKRAILDSLEGARPEVSLSLAGAECMKACVKRMFVTE